jgi:hypothetical protein
MESTNSHDSGGDVLVFIVDSHFSEHAALLVAVVDDDGNMAARDVTGSGRDQFLSGRRYYCPLRSVLS